MSRTMLRTLLVLGTMLGAAGVAVASDCQEGRIRVRVDGSWIEEKAAYCFEAGSGFLLSRACADDPLACRRKYVSQKLGPEPVKPIQIGSPGFKACERVHGKPEMIDYFWNGEWAESDRCLLEHGSKWFVSTGQVANWVVETEEKAAPRRTK